MNSTGCIDEPDTATGYWCSVLLETLLGAMWNMFYNARESWVFIITGSGLPCAVNPWC